MLNAATEAKVTFTDRALFLPGTHKMKCCTVLAVALLAAAAFAQVII
jgi:hypothetical protein